MIFTRKKMTSKTYQCPVCLQRLIDSFEYTEHLEDEIEQLEQEASALEDDADILRDELENI